MPAILEDPSTPTMHRMSGHPPYPNPNEAPSLPAEIQPRHLTLRDGSTATLLAFASKQQVPLSLGTFLCGLLNLEIERGDTYPMLSTMEPQQFINYWFQNVGIVMFSGHFASVDDIMALETAASATATSPDWLNLCLGTFYIKPNYPGRSSHVCNAGFLVSSAARGRGVGRLMGEAYVDWAPALGYRYSVFNLVYETNVPSCRIWDALGFQKIGRVPGCGALKSFPGKYVDAIVYGRSFVPPEEEHRYVLGQD